jgi:hypothetical protein
MIGRLFGILEKVVRIVSFVTDRAIRNFPLPSKMSQASVRRRPTVHISLQRAARLHRLVRSLSGGPLARPNVLSELRIGLRTFYRELELLNRCGVKVRYKSKLYHLLPTAAEAEGRLPFPDPQLSFAEMTELAQCDCAAGRRLAELLATVIKYPEPGRKRSGATRRGKRTGGRSRG